MSNSTTLSHMQVQENEVSLVDLALTLWNGRWWILGFTFLGACIGLTVAIFSPNIYESKVVYIIKGEKPTINMGGAAALLGMAGGSTSVNLSKYKPILESTDLLVEVIERHQLLKPLFPKLLDTTTGNWRQDLEEMPSILDAVNELRKKLRISFGKKDEETLILSVLHEDPQLAYQWVKFFAETFLERIEIMEAAESEQTLEFYRRKLKEAESPDARAALAQLLAEETRKSLLLGRSKFQEIDKARLPEKKIKPQRAVICVVSVLISFLFATLTILIWSVFTRNKQEHP